MIGGTGVLGGLVARTLLEGGDQVRLVSRSAPAAGSAAAALVAAGAGHHVADLRSGDGLAAALGGADAVVDAVNDPRGAKQVMVEGGGRLLAAEAAAGVGHHVAVSIVGIEQVPLAYYTAKLAQERVVTDGPVPWSLLRATQFHQLLDQAFAAAARLRLLPGGAAQVQPIDPAIVAARLADAVHAGPCGRLPQLGGPRVQTLGELAREWRAARGRRLPVVPLPWPPRLGRALRGGSLTAPDAAVEGPAFAQWLAQPPADVAESVLR
ncbi:NAD(P)H-binding protein [Conexibacter sp. CPCC 205706]|uniref:SDR family oxidoreductase n=1 Tax=Conexibacter sp. CPCC 205706 TaxID=3064572 RepID=UPI0027225EE9|nr:NmrA family NAD(P)-binding protein [Conexibacter sp. CPCC 205706]MDO8186358.1 NAD(P)H-binding protein [Conexibacter sp. CPCC 205706]